MGVLSFTFKTAGACVVFHGGVAGDLNSSLCIAFCCDVLIFIFRKKPFVREKFCKMQNTGSPEQVTGVHRNVRINTSSKPCCLLPKPVGIYLQYLKQRRGCFKRSKSEGIFLWFVFVMKLHPEDLGEP